MNDPNARINALKAGEVDGGWMVPSNGIDQLKTSREGKVYFGTNTAVASMIVSNLKGTLGDVRVRQALTMAIDRDGLLKAAEQGYGTVTNAITTEVGLERCRRGHAPDRIRRSEEVPV